MDLIWKIAGPAVVIASPLLLFNGVSANKVTDYAVPPVEECLFNGAEAIKADWPALNFAKCDAPMRFTFAINDGTVGAGKPDVPLLAFGHGFAREIDPAVTEGKPPQPPVRSAAQGGPKTGAEATAKPSQTPAPLARMDVVFKAADEIPQAAPEKPEAEGEAQAAQPAAEHTFWLAPQSPVIEAVIGGEARAIPLSVMLWHGVTNTRLNGQLVAIAYDPFTNSAKMFDRRASGKNNSFGIAGLLHHGSFLMYDANTRSWWRIYDGKAIAGKLAGQSLREFPVRIISLAEYKRLHGDDAKVQVPSHESYNAYANNGYQTTPLGMLDSADMAPGLALGVEMPEGASPMAYVVAIGNRAWTLDALKAKGEITTEDGLVLKVVAEGDTLAPSSALNAPVIAEAQKLANISVTRDDEPVAQQLTFAYAFFTFNKPDGVLHGKDGDIRWPQQQAQAEDATPTGGHH